MWTNITPYNLFIQRTQEAERFLVVGFCDNWGQPKDTDKEDWAIEVDLHPLSEEELSSLFNDVPHSLSFEELKEIKSKQYGHKFDLICACRLYREKHQNEVQREQQIALGL